jgi:hypothetical protein
MNVFVLCTGRCGSLTFARACAHIRNYSSGHESRVGRVGADRLTYSPRHIEVDNRLSWFLGRLDLRFGDEAFYVHLTRRPEEVAASYARRHPHGIIGAYDRDILYVTGAKHTPHTLGLDYCDTVTTNIELFLRDKTRKMTVTLEELKDGFCTFWDRIGAQGDLTEALATLEVRHNASR